jgi:hypothetical protein
MSLPYRLTFRHGGRAHEHHKTFRKRMRQILSISMKHTLSVFTALGNAADPLELNVRAFGAKGDGSTDDTAAFDTEIADGVKLKLPVRVPQGSYVITQPLALKAQRLTGEPNASFVAPALMIGGGEIVSITGNAITPRAPACICGPAASDWCISAMPCASKASRHRRVRRQRPPRAPRQRRSADPRQDA